MGMMFPPSDIMCRFEPSDFETMMKEAKYRNDLPTIHDYEEEDAEVNLKSSMGSRGESPSIVTLLRLVC